MLLRPYQDRAVGKIVATLEERKKTLFVAATGAGKTVMLSEVIRRTGRRTLVLQHRDELVEQNRRTLIKLCGEIPSSLYTAAEKRWSAGVTYGMVQTITRNLDTMPVLDLVIVDEAHLYRAPTFQAVIERALTLNPECWVLGVTATPKRGDGANLKALFDNVCDEVTIGELVRGGFLVPPKAFVLDLGVSAELDGVKKLKTGEYDSKAVADILKARPVTEAVIKHWRDKAGDRSTIVFCATMAHAAEMTEAFHEAGVTAAMVTGATKKPERQATVKAFDRGDVQVLVNVSVAREGFDSQRVGCIVLLRKESFESTLIQMVGRGLRIVDPERYPGVVKADCIVLDFGRSLLTHGGIFQVFKLSEDQERTPEQEQIAASMAPKKTCGECEMDVPIQCRECPACGAAFPPPGDSAERLEDFELVELDLLIESSPFRWWFRNDATRCVSAMEAWTIVICVRETWHAFGGAGKGDFHHLAEGAEVTAVAAGDDWMRRHADAKSAGRAARWHKEPPTAQQVAYLRRLERVVLTNGSGRYHALVEPAEHTRYEIGCLIELERQREAIIHCLRQLVLPLEEKAA